jgi:hypothetical protein
MMVFILKNNLNKVNINLTKSPSLNFFISVFHFHDFKMEDLFAF